MRRICYIARMARRLAQQLELDLARAETQTQPSDTQQWLTRVPRPRARGKLVSHDEHTRVADERRSAAAALLETPGALLTRSHLRELGLERRAVDAIFRALPVVALPGYSRPMIRVHDYLELMDAYTYRDDRVRSSVRP
jgi:hypothetical protein